MFLPVHDCCPICAGPVASASIELAHGRDDLAIRTYNCPRCGPVRMTPISLVAEPARVKKIA